MFYQNCRHGQLIRWSDLKQNLFMVQWLVFYWPDCSNNTKLVACDPALTVAAPASDPAMMVALTSKNRMRFKKRSSAVEVVIF